MRGFMGEKQQNRKRKTLKGASLTEVERGVNVLVNTPLLTVVKLAPLSVAYGCIVVPLT